MRKVDYDNVFNGILEELKVTREAGQKEYAHGAVDDVFNNFNRLAGDLDIDRKKVLWVYFNKHRDGIAAYLKGHVSQREDVRGRIKDSIVYLMLLWGMIEEETGVTRLVYERSPLEETTEETLRQLTKYDVKNPENYIQRDAQLLESLEKSRPAGQIHAESLSAEEIVDSKIAPPNDEELF